MRGLRIKKVDFINCIYKIFLKYKKFVKIINQVKVIAKLNTYICSIFYNYYYINNFLYICQMIRKNLSVDIKFQDIYTKSHLSRFKL